MQLAFVTNPGSSNFSQRGTPNDIHIYSFFPRFSAQSGGLKPARPEVIRRISFAMAGFSVRDVAVSSMKGSRSSKTQGELD